MSAYWTLSSCKEIFNLRGANIQSTNIKTEKHNYDFFMNISLLKIHTDTLFFPLFPVWSTIT